MSAHADFSPEFDLVDSEDGPLSYLEFINSDDPDSLHTYEASRAADSKAVLTPAPNPPLLSNHASSPESPSPSSSDSSSDSASSKQSRGAAAYAKSSYMPGDVIMDGLEFTSDWKVEDFLHTEDDHSIATDGTVNPLSIENQFCLNSAAGSSSFEFQSPSSTPSPFASGVSEHMVASPQFQNVHDAPLSQASGPKTSPKPSNPIGRGHGKAMSQHSLTQFMGDLKTKSREVSPTSNMVFSQDSSPSAILNNSPSPAAIDFLSATGMGMTGFSFANGLPSAPNQINGNMTTAMFSNQAVSTGLSTQPPFPMYQQPQFGSTTPQYRLIINQTPLKSRVETQIPVKLRISPLPPGIKRLHLPRHTISKPKLIAKPRPERSPDMLELSVMLVCTSAMQNPDLRKRAMARAASSSSTLKSPDSQADDEGEDLKPQDGGEVHICAGCITRERKRAARKKAKKPEEEENWTRDEHRRVVVFNTHEIKEWQDPNAPGPKPAQSGHYLTDGVIDAPMRIACYCRHHQEKGGFRVIFTIKDHMDKLVAQQLSESIMITDDHKTPHTTQATSSSSQSGPSSSSETSLIPASLNPAPPDPNASSPGASVPGSSHSNPDVSAMKSVTFPSSISASQPPQPSIVQTPRNLSRPVSPNGTSGPSAKKRKSSGGIIKVPPGLAMTRIETSQSPSASGKTGHINAAMAPATSPYTPNLGSFPMAAESLFGGSGNTNASAAGAPFNPGPQTPNGNEQQVLFAAGNRTASLDNLAMAQLYSAPGSTHPSRAPSPNSLRNSANAAHQQQSQSQLERALATGMYNLPMPMAQPRTPLSVIHKIIPNEGPKSGGIEVTILGGGFYQGLEVMFGDQKATTTTFWGESSLVCLLPPSPISGAVLVTFKQNGQPAPQQFTSATKHQPVFKYVDDDEQQLMRTALSVLGHKMTGKIEDVRDVARRIIGGGSGDGSSWTGSGGNGQGPVGGGTYNGFSFDTATVESQLLKVLDLIDLDDSTHKARLNLQRRTGQTMLHLACSLGLHRFVAALLARGANPDARDKGGYTPLHIASLNNHIEIVRRLISKGADPTIRTLSGMTAADMSQSREVLKAIRRLERHTRSRSGGSIHSRVSSATSLRSLWEPATTQPTAKEYTTEESTSSGESPEYSENATSEDDAELETSEEGGNAWLDMRRPSNGVSSPEGISPSDDVADLQPGGLGSPSAAVTAFREQCRDQFQHIQQAMALRLPTFAQFPNYFSQMGPRNFPGMAPLSDYQGYLNSAPVLQRISSLVPQISGGNGDEQRPEQQRRDMDGKWWDFSGLVNQSSVPPPAYEDIYPHQNDQDAVDMKQASAVRAAAEAEADMKCATIYDDAVTTGGPSLLVDQIDEEVVPQQQQQLPALLQIGRKNSITKEQEENLRRAHAEKRKGLRSDRNLFIIWIPVLVLVLCATLYNKIPTVISAINSLFPPQDLAADVVEAAGTTAGRLQQPARRIVDAL